MPLQNRMILSTSARLSHWIRIISTWFRMDTDTTKNHNANRQRSEPTKERSMLVCMSNTMMMIQVYRHKFLIRCRHSAISPPLETPS